MSISSNRRKFLKFSGLTMATVATGALTGLRSSFAQSANDQVLLTMFLRGGSDGMSWLHPRPGTSPARARYEAWRGNAIRIANGARLQGNLAMHPALEPLRPAFNRGHATLVGGVAGAQQNRSHFQQMDLVESGAGPTGSAGRIGIYGRAFNELGLTNSALARLALSTQSPLLLQSVDGPALSSPDFRKFGRLRSTDLKNNPNRDLQRRLESLFTVAGGCGTNRFCNSGQLAADAVQDLSALRTQASLPGGNGSNLPTLLTDLAKLIAADTTNAFKFVNVDVGGWDTHVSQGNDAMSGGNFPGTLAGNLNGIANALLGFYNEARTLGCWDRVTVLVITEFGRTTRQNGTGGTDHGYGGTALVMGRGLQSRVLANNYFPSNTSNAFYSTAESTNALPRSVEHRQLFHEILQARLGLNSTALANVLPGFSRDTSIPTLFS